jgi:parvulin-like peptidyl-prolyl isomerase
VRRYFAMALLVNGEAIDDALIEWEAASLRNQFRQLTPEQRESWGLDAAAMEKRAREWSRENVIERTLLRQEALKDGEPVPAEMIDQALEELKKRHGGEDKFSLTHGDDKQLREDLEARLRLDRLIGKINAKISAPKRKDIAEHYRKHREQFRSPETVRASHIVKNVNENRDEPTARAEIDAVAEALRAGASFEELADQHSDCAGNGGDLGYFPRGQMVDEFDDVVFEMEPGAVSAVFHTVFGFHIARLVERQPARVKPLPEVEEEIQAELLRQKQTRALENFVDRLRAKADVREVPAAEAAAVVTPS